MVAVDTKSPTIELDLNFVDQLARELVEHAGQKAARQVSMFASSCNAFHMQHSSPYREALILLRSGVARDPSLQRLGVPHVHCSSRPRSRRATVSNSRAPPEV